MEGLDKGGQGPISGCCAVEEDKGGQGPISGCCAVEEDKSGFYFAGSCEGESIHRSEMEAKQL
jgi:hypothetical protein